MFLNPDSGLRVVIKFLNRGYEYNCLRCMNLHGITTKIIIFILVHITKAIKTLYDFNYFRVDI